MLFRSMKMITVLVVSCPCAISLCVPMVVVIAVSVAAKKGVLFKVRRAELLLTSNFTHPNLIRWQLVHRVYPVREGHDGRPLR